MNTLEAIARELVRVGKLRAKYLAMGDDGIFAIQSIDSTIEVACRAIGDGNEEKLNIFLAILKEYKS